MNIDNQVSPVIDVLLNNLRGSVERELTTSISSIVENLVSQVNTNLVASANIQVATEISQAIAKIDVRQLVSEVVKQTLESMVQTSTFPDQSIPHTSVNFEGMVLSGNSIKGGIINQFGSDGIEDRSSFVQLTLMDHACVFEGPVFAPASTIKGNLEVDGEFILNGSFNADTPAFEQLIEHSSHKVRSLLNDELFASFSDIIYSRIQEEGVSLDKITQDGKIVLTGNKLGYHITDSNIQRLGIVRDFQTVGENYLSETLYVSGHRVGVNTMEPSAALAVWDQECEIITAKRRAEVGYIGTQRRQQLVLGSNNKENLILDVDGSVQIESLVLNRISMTSGSSAPTSEGKLGQIVFNERPALGRHIGWVCIGGTRWASFGKIE